MQSAVHMIRRGQGEILKLLRERMADAAERLDFERAALIRDQIAAIEKVSRGQKVVRSEVDEQDVLWPSRAPRRLYARPFCVSERDVWWTKESFCFTTPKTSPPCGRSFCPAIIWRTTSSSRRALPWMSCPRVRASLRACWARRGAARCGCMCLSGAIPPVWWRWRAPMPWNVWHGKSGRYAREQKHLDELAALLGLKEPPRIIESYDISNWGDGTSVAGMVVFEDGKPKKAGYRRFKMNTVAGTDDYASMAETLARRAAEYEKGAKGQFGIKPDLLLIDGGRGQVSAVQAALAGTQLADVPMFGMVKDDKHRTRGLVSAAGGEIMLAMHRGVFTFVTSIQDEDAPLGQRLPQAHAEKPRLFFHAAKRAGRRPGHQPRADGPFQNGVCR